EVRRLWKARARQLERVRSRQGAAVRCRTTCYRAGTGSCCRRPLDASCHVVAADGILGIRRSSIASSTRVGGEVIVGGRGSRTGSKLVLAFVDVDGLKAVNDSQGHLAGDALLRLLGETLRANVRPYDVIVRYGGDELLCAMSNLGVPEARARFEKIAAALAAADADHSITFGLA